MRPLCDRKKVPLSAAQNAAAEYWLFTDVPPAGNVTGVILNDLGNEFNPNSPAFGEKYAPPNVPVGFYDWNGKEVGRVYADFGGRYNLMVPSTFTTNLPQPSGMSPNMLISCMNDAGTGADADPFWNPQFSQFCYTFQYMPGTATYLDTPVEPIAAFASPITYPGRLRDADDHAGDRVGHALHCDGRTLRAARARRFSSTPWVMTEVDNPTGTALCRHRARSRATTASRPIARSSSKTSSVSARHWLGSPVQRCPGLRRCTGRSCRRLPGRGDQLGLTAESPIGVTLTVGSTQGGRYVQRPPCAG